jgi:hypothetical protein
MASVVDLHVTEEDMMFTSDPDHYRHGQHSRRRYIILFRLLTKS